MVVGGANGELLVLDEDDRAAIAAADLLLLQLELPLAVTVAAAAHAAAVGVPVLLNPSPARALPPELLDSVAILVVNEGEAAAIGADALAGAPHVVTTLGARGATYRASEASFGVPAPAILAIDTHGSRRCLHRGVRRCLGQRT